ncbi:TraR/DksA C4-type zinc finger protein [Rhizobium sullae]|uniref:TraR/DksA C4-type zinc finger protein n=1 Tax=Rhizobium sullae TaxID=50338 RepID=A0ABY5XGV5_RHISU|nr:TraR/DksA C4-type zinc finger protein [Rhizobium sullae]UWU13257.1 TraR/DksA C4-type zinc finger protein [Rhizobium sullae]
MNGNALFDLAEIRAEEEREAQIAAASRSLKQAGSVDCEDCPAEISPERRRAMPSTVRCFDCQQRFEQRMRRSR